LAEPHLVIDGKMRKLPEFLHAIKSKADLEDVHLGVWDFREPIFKRFRQDKKAEPKDVPASQLFG